MKYLHGVKYRVGLALCSLALVASQRAAAQQVPPADSTRPSPIGVRVRLGGDTLPLRLPALRLLVERESYLRAQEQIAIARATAFQQNMRAVLEATWGQVAAQTFATPRQAAPYPTEPPPRARPTVADRAAGVLSDYADLTVALDGRVELRAEQTKNARCASGLAFDPVANCRSGFEPLFDFQASLRSGGVVADRMHVNVDYDSQREFESSNTISIAYEGKANERLERFEIGNVSFQPPRSQFITAGIPSNNTGMQAVVRLGAMRLRAIMAQQKGHVVRDRTFTIGDRALKAIDRAIEDYQFEPRRFFFTVDPRLLSGYPNIDLLNGARMAQLAASLPDTLRPTRLYVYRLLIGGQPANPSGPQFRLLNQLRSRRGQVYEYLREGVDYYADPSLLWIALVRPLTLSNERLVVAYRVRVGGQDTVHVTSGGTPELEFRPDHEQWANLLWDPEIKPGDPAFDREIRGVYRIGGSDVLRNSVTVKIITGPTEDQERPVAGGADTYLELFGLAQQTNSSAFDLENRLWPRPTDPNLAVTFAGGAARTLRDRFLVFPSVLPFARDGLTRSNPSNDAIYTTPGEYLNTPRRPQTVYRLRVRYQSEGGGESGSVMLGSVQLRPSSERISVDGVPLVRGVDYVMDYELGRVSFTRPDTLFRRPRQVVVQYEENPVFADTPTSILGGTAEFAFDNGEIAFSALSQTQKTTFNRPPLGFEPASALIAGISGSFAFDAEPLTRLVSRLPGGESGIPSRISVSGEFAMSRPKPNVAGQAYLESFEGEGGIPIPLTELSWYYSSQPALGSRVASRYGGNVFDPERAATLAWQSGGLDASGRIVQYSIREIDPQTELFGAGVTGPEPLLWLTLYPLSIRGVYDEVTRAYRWRSASVIGRRWRSIRIPLGPSGTDLTRVENLEFWAQIPIDAGPRTANPVLVFDLGDISENTLAFSPDSALVLRRGLTIDTLYLGAHAVGLDRLDSERDPFSRAFNVTVNDVGLPGDVADSLVILTDTLPGEVTRAIVRGAPICLPAFRTVRLLGDSRANCTVRNNHLDDEDVDADNVLNLTGAERGSEQWRRYIVDLASTPYTRLGRCGPSAGTIHRPVFADRVCWAFFRIPFRSPDDSLGVPLLRRTRAMRITMISGAIADHEFTQVPIARLRLTGAPWLKRDDRTVRGLAGDATAAGLVAAGVIGTQDRNTARGISYESPPGVADEPDVKTATFAATRLQVNERSLRLTASQLQPLERAEAYYRFTEGQKNFMGYQEMRLWARGIGNGWGEDGELQVFVRLGRDPNNFYLYRVPLNGGETRAAWLPEIRVDFRRLFALRAQVQNAYLRGGRRNTCTGQDSILLAAGGATAAGQAFAACDGGYVVYTTDPVANAPNLAAVQELAVGIVRVSAGTGTRPITAADTVELWVDDIRLTDVVNEPGFAARVGGTVIASDFADVRFSLTRRDPHFRQIGERPGYLTSTGVDLTTAFRLEKLFPRSFALSIPVTFNYTSAADDPLFLSQSDIDAKAVEGVRTPRADAASYTIQVRRARPSSTSILGAVLDNLGLSSTYTAARARSEYQDGRASRFTLGADLNVSRALFPQASRWMPSELYLTSVFTKSHDDRVTFIQPVDKAVDAGRAVSGRSKMWKQGTIVAFRPWDGVGARMDFSSVRDLRRYDATGSLGFVSGVDRARVAGLDVGAERERALQSSVTVAPQFGSWFRPRFNFGSSYTMLRDPNTPFFARPLQSGTVRELRVPRRLANTQTMTAGFTFDPAGAVAALSDSSRPARTILAVLQPLDVAVNRTVLSLYEGTFANAPLHYQLALGGTSAFRALRGDPATSAGVNNQFTISEVLRLPMGATLTGRYAQTTLRNWTLRNDATQAMADGEQRVFPDVALRWAGRPLWLAELISNASLTARVVETRQEFGSPGAFLRGPLDDRGTLHTRSYPLTLSTIWSAVPGMTTNLTFARTRRTEVRPGLDTRLYATELSGDVAKPFALPRSWNVRSPLRTRVSYESGGIANFVANPLARSNVSRITDNGRRAWTVTADTDAAENLTAGFVMSRVLSFDRNLNRRFTQTILSAVLQMHFFGGELK